MTAAERLGAIRASWWLDGRPEGLVYCCGQLAGVTTLAYEREYLRIAVREPLLATDWSDPRIPPALALTVTLRRRWREPLAWDVVDGADALALAAGFVPVVGPLPAPWAVLAVGAAYNAAALAQLRRRLLRELSR